MTDTELLRKILARDRGALHYFYKTYAPKLSSYIAVRVRETRDCEEILQDTLFAFLEALRDFHGKSRISTFLFSICNHKIIDYYRRRKLKQVMFSQMPQLESLISPLLNPEEELDATMLKEKIQNVFVRIIPRYRKILLWKYSENRSVDEIARKLNISFKSAESQLFRARKAFVKAFIAM